MWISLLTLIVGIVASALISRYYFRRSTHKSLTPYVQFSSSPLTGIDPKVRDELDIRYQRQPVDNLHEIQFLIANTGDKAIRDIIEPLTLLIPDGCSLLDATLLHVSPEGRKIDLAISDDKRSVIFGMRLLNSEEFFIVKLLLNGKPKPEDFVFNISADELPPTLAPEPLPLDSLQPDRKGEKKTHYEFVMLGIGIFSIACGISIARLVYDSWSKLPAFDISSAKQIFSFFSNLGWTGTSILLSPLASFFVIIFGIAAVAVFFDEFDFPLKKKKFVVPSDKQILRGPHVDT